MAQHAMGKRWAMGPTYVVIKDLFLILRVIGM
jgi:hypothetical protein